MQKTAITPYALLTALVHACEGMCVIVRNDLQTIVHLPSGKTQFWLCLQCEQVANRIRAGEQGPFVAHTGEVVNP